jgi:hypothetical protein
MAPVAYQAYAAKILGEAEICTPLYTAIKEVGLYCRCRHFITVIEFQATR